MKDQAGEREGGLAGDAALSVAVLTACLYAAGEAVHRSYFDHWTLPEGMPPWTTDTLLRKGFESGIGFGVLFLVWLAASGDRILRKPAANPKWAQRIRGYAPLLPVALFVFIEARIIQFIWNRLGNAEALFAIVMLVIIAIVFAAAIVWFIRSIAKGGLLGHSRGTDAAIHSIVALTCILSASLYGAMWGDVEGRIDADGNRSTLHRVTFAFANESHNRTEWRLLAHVEGVYYVFDLDPALTERGHPVVFLIPESAVLHARVGQP